MGYDTYSVPCTKCFEMEKGYEAYVWREQSNTVLFTFNRLRDIDDHRNNRFENFIISKRTVEEYVSEEIAYNFQVGNSENPHLKHHNYWAKVQDIPYLLNA